MSKNGNTLAQRFVRSTALRSTVNILLSLVAVAAFFGALFFGQDEKERSVIQIALSMPLNMTAIVLLVLFGLFALFSITLVALQFKRPSSSSLITAIQTPMLVIAFFLTDVVCHYKKTSRLMYIICVGVTVILFIFGVLSYVYSDNKISLKKEGRVRSLIMMILAIIIEVSVFFVPVLSFTTKGTPKSEVLFYIFSSTKSTLLSTILFVVYFLVLVVTVLVAINHLKYLFQDNDRFNAKLGRVIYLSSGVTLSFFLVGTLISFYYKSNGIHTDSSSISYIPFIFSIGLMIADALYNGRYKEIHKSLNRKGIAMRVLMLFFIYAFAALTVISISSNIIIASFENESFGSLKVNGLDIIMNYKQYGESYQTLAFLLMGILEITALTLLISTIAFFRNSKLFKSMFLVSVSVDFMWISALAAFAKYYEVVQKANLERLESLFAFYNIPLDIQYNVSSDVFYYFLIAVGVLVLLFLFRPYTRYVIEENARDEITISSDSVIGVENLTPPGASDNATAAAMLSTMPMVAQMPDGMQLPEGMTIPEIDPENFTMSVANPENASINAPLSLVPPPQVNVEVNVEEPTPPPQEEAPQKPSLPIIDQCPPFTFLDEQEPVYQEKLVEREQTKFEEITLKSLVEFVVDYAKNSRLHLSYTPEDIATFVAGLGIGRLSILQGMSGTGKTSLPKIFSEAIFGNCEIVEVESSWKDKNELLGYYNEFSRIYTPKKFTQDLYKAKLNPDVITFIVLDEMNLSRIEYYFSDFLSLMENEEDKREIKLVNIRIANYESGERVPYKQLKDDMVLKIPNNVWFIGTANRDESTFEISDKVYDRASTMNFNKRAKKITKFDDPMTPKFLDAATFRSLMQNAMETSTFDLSSAKQIAKAEELLAPYNLSFGNRIERQIENFVKIYSACFKGKNVVKDALEKIFLSKVVAKLEFKTVENKDELADNFDSIGLSKCADFIRKLNEDI